MAQRKAKEEIRLEMRKILTSLDGRWLNAASKGLCGVLSELCHSNKIGSNARILAWSKSFKGEPDLSMFIAEQVLTRHTYLPRMEGAGEMNFIKIDENWSQNLEKYEGKIFQPVTGELFDFTTDEPIVILVPGLAFDRRGGRLGRGKGYYDRFLSFIEGRPMTTIGIAWSLQVVPEVPLEKHDVRVDYVCTEEEWFHADS